MKISCFGCSFTWGLELNQPQDQAWPALIGARNFGQCGASNQSITRLLLEHLVDSRPDFVVIMWTYTHRYEFVLDNNNFVSTHCDSTISLDEKPVPDYFEKFREYFFRNTATTDSEGIYTSLMAINHAESVLKQMNIPYVFSRVSDFNINEGCHPQVQTLYHAYAPDMMLFDNLSFEDYARKIDSWGRSHPLEQAHRDIANALKQTIKRLT